MKVKKMFLMKVKKMLVMMVAVFSMVALLAVNAHAARQWYTCTIVDAGPTWGGVYLRLTDDGGAFYEKWFQFRPDQEKEMLATALTAMSNNMKVKALIDLDDGHWAPQILGFRLAP